MASDYSTVLADLREKRDKLTAAIEILEELQGPRPQNGSIPPHVPKVVARKPRTGTVASMAHEIIRAHGGPMKIADVVASLRAMGKFQNPDARSNYGTVFGTLNDDKGRFVKVGEGLFEIRERARVHGTPDREHAVTLGPPGTD